MQITEIYKSIQGESTHAGLPCIFVRLTGCNLRCSWCDANTPSLAVISMCLQKSSKQCHRDLAPAAWWNSLAVSRCCRTKKLCRL